MSGLGLGLAVWAVGWYSVGSGRGKACVGVGAEGGLVGLGFVGFSRVYRQSGVRPG